MQELLGTLLIDTKELREGYDIARKAGDWKWKETPVAFWEGEFYGYLGSVKSDGELIDVRRRLDEMDGRGSTRILGLALILSSKRGVYRGNFDPTRIGLWGRVDEISEGLRRRVGNINYE